MTEFMWVFTLSFCAVVIGELAINAWRGRP